MASVFLLKHCIIYLIIHIPAVLSQNLRKSETLTPFRKKVNGAEIFTNYLSVFASNNTWNVRINSQIGWQFIIMLDNSWGFDPNHYSSITITINSPTINPVTPSFDALIFGFASNNAEYISTFIPMDNSQSNLIYPQCRSSSNSAPIHGIGDIASAPYFNRKCDVAGGSCANWQNMYPLNLPTNRNVFPITFRLENDQQSDTLRLSFTTNGFHSEFEQFCYYTASLPGRGLKVYIGGNEKYQSFAIKSIRIQAVTIVKSPTLTPTSATMNPTNRPSLPTNTPSFHPTRSTLYPTEPPFVSVPTLFPSDSPTNKPTPHPTKGPTNRPTDRPTNKPTNRPTDRPTNRPTNKPTISPTSSTGAPTTLIPTPFPSNTPTKRPTDRPSNDPTKRPTNNPTKRPTKKPTKRPTKHPTKRPTNKPTDYPTKTPTFVTKSPTNDPTFKPTLNPTKVTDIPTISPSTNPSYAPTKSPTDVSDSPTNNPTFKPSSNPSKVTNIPSISPTNDPTFGPTNNPTDAPTKSPTEVTKSPTNDPTLIPSSNPSKVTNIPSLSPTTAQPTAQPTLEPTAKPTLEPTSKPTTAEPTVYIPTHEPTLEPTPKPTTAKPTIDYLHPVPFHTHFPSFFPLFSFPSVISTLSPPKSVDIHPSLPTLSPTQRPTLNPVISPTNMDTIITVDVDIDATNVVITQAQEVVLARIVVQHADKSTNKIIILCAVCLISGVIARLVISHYYNKKAPPARKNDVHKYKMPQKLVPKLKPPLFKPMTSASVTHVHLIRVHFEDRQFNYAIEEERDITDELGEYKVDEYHWDEDTYQIFMDAVVNEYGLHFIDFRLYEIVDEQEEDIKDIEDVIVAFDSTLNTDETHRSIDLYLQIIENIPELRAPTEGSRRARANTETATDTQSRTNTLKSSCSTYNASLLEDAWPIQQWKKILRSTKDITYKKMGTMEENVREHYCGALSEECDDESDEKVMQMRDESNSSDLSVARSYERSRTLTEPFNDDAISIMETPTPRSMADKSNSNTNHMHSPRSVEKSSTNPFVFYDNVRYT